MPFCHVTISEKAIANSVGLHCLNKAKINNNVLDILQQTMNPKLDRLVHQQLVTFGGHTNKQTDKVFVS